jgi:glycosyltransferase involved in cell wall biosynthesis
LPDEQQTSRADHAAEFANMGCVPHFVEVDDFFRMKTTTTSFPEVTAELVEIIDRHDIDVVHAEALYCARVAAAVKEIRPSIYFSIDWHGIVPEESRMGGAHAVRVSALEEAERTLLSWGDLNVFVSESMGTHYRRKYGEIATAQVIVPCCVSDKRFVDATEGSMRSVFPPSSLVFGYAGTMADWQCGAEMIALFATLHREDARCRFLMLVPRSDQAKVTEYCTAAGLPTEAMVMLEVPHDDVPKHLCECDVGVLLRRQDPVNFVSSPTKFGEYLGAGLPVLMTDAIGDYSRLAERTGVGFVIPYARLFGAGDDASNPDLLQRIIAFALRSSASRAVESRRCQTVAREELHWEPAAASWIGMYRKLEKPEVVEAT